MRAKSGMKWRMQALVAVGLLMTAARPAQGQMLIGYLLGEKLATPNFNMGFEIGVNFDKLDGMGTADRVTKTVFGLFADWRFSEHFHLTSAFLPIAARGADGLTPVPTGDPAIDSQAEGGTMARTLGVIEFPLLLKWSPKRQTGFRIGAGPSMALITSATDRYEATTSAGTPYVLERDIENQLPGTDFGLSVDVEWRFQMLSIAGRYTHGLTTLATGSDGSKIQTRTLTGTGRIYLGKKKKAAGDTPPPK